MSHASDQSKHPICREDTHVASKLDWRVCSRRRTDGDDRRRTGGRRREIPQLERPVERRQPASRRPGHKVRSHQGVGTGAAGTADAGISEGVGGQHGRSGQGRARQLPHRPDIITPETTYIVAGIELRRIFTDGRDWPTNAEPTYQGYSIGRWIDEDGDGRYDVLEVDTRGPFKGPRAYDASGLPLHFDNQSTFKERFHLDKNDLNILHDEITVFDHALTRPWSVDKTFRRNPNAHPNWGQTFCTEGNNQIVIGTENYFLSGEGLLMPAKKDQAPPDLRYFKQTRKQ